MLRTLQAKDFAAVPYLETSQLMTHHQGVVSFSLDKPNVIIGPNGSGKSALLTSMALRFLTYYFPRSSLDHHYIDTFRNSGIWTEGHDKKTYARVALYLPGLVVDTDSAPAVYYRPNHLPGNEPDIAHAMLTGYFEEAREFGNLTDKKSSGEQCRALLQSLVKVLQGKNLPKEYLAVNWRHGREVREVSRTSYVGDIPYRVNALLELTRFKRGALPLVMMDEPEQSLDTLGEMQLWEHIAKANCSKMQLVVATHSLYPLVHPEKFNIIESVPGYMQQVLELFK